MVNDHSISLVLLHENIHFIAERKNIKSYTYSEQRCIKATSIKQQTFQKLRAQEPLKTALLYCSLHCSAKDSSAMILRIRKNSCEKKKNIFNSVASFVPTLVYSHVTK